MKQKLRTDGTSMEMRNVTNLSGAILFLACSFAAVANLTAQTPELAVPKLAPPNPADATIQLQFPNNGISDVLGIYELLTGKPVVKESSIFDGKPISLVTAQPITLAEA